MRSTPKKSAAKKNSKKQPRGFKEIGRVATRAAEEMFGNDGMFGMNGPEQLFEVLDTLDTKQQKLFKARFIYELGERLDRFFAEGWSPNLMDDEEWQCLDETCTDMDHYHSHPGPQRVGKKGKKR